MFLYFSGLALNLFKTLGDGVKAQPEAIFIFSASIRSKTESCNISEYIVRFLKSELTNPFSTALAIDPTLIVMVGGFQEAWLL